MIARTRVEFFGIILHIVGGYKCPLHITLEGGHGRLHELNLLEQGVGPVLPHICLGQVSSGQSKHCTYYYALFQESHLFYSK